MTKIEAILDVVTTSGLIKVDGFTIRTVGTSKILDVADNQVLRLSWVGEQFQTYCAQFTEEALEEADAQHNTLDIVDTEGDSVLIELFEVEPVDLSYWDLTPPKLKHIRIVD